MYSVLVDFRNRNNLVLIKRLSKNNTNKMTNQKKGEQGESVEGSKYVFKHDYTWTKAVTFFSSCIFAKVAGKCNWH